ncbi:MAG: hypothetical protein C4519_08650 [Desulfobacteraceae bacterium]|nr:MAG: hypothetical protein C4519_08650 [Desulfobacteraceae bacterium]
MIALAVFAVLSAIIMSMLVGAIRTNSTARKMTEASALAADVVEYLSGLPFNHPELVDTPPWAQGPYAVSYTVDPDALIANTLSIGVTVSWPDEKMGTRSVNFDYHKKDII